MRAQLKSRFEKLVSLASSWLQSRTLRGLGPALLVIHGDSMYPTRLLVSNVDGVPVPMKDQLMMFLCL